MRRNGRRAGTPIEIAASAEFLVDERWRSAAGGRIGIGIGGDPPAIDGRDRSSPVDGLTGGIVAAPSTIGGRTTGTRQFSAGGIVAAPRRLVIDGRDRSSPVEN